MNPTIKQRVQQLFNAPTAQELAAQRQARKIAKGYKRIGRKHGVKSEVRCLKDAGYCEFLGSLQRWYSEPLYKCRICDKAYHFQGHIMIHAADHIDVKRFACSVCMKPFKNQKSVQNHILIKHKIPKRDSLSHIIKYW